MVDAVSDKLEIYVLGMQKFDAIIKIENANHIARITAEDGEHFMHTMDFCNNRVNIEIINGKVSSAYKG